MAGMARFIRQTTAHVVLLVVGMGSAPLLAQNCPDLVGRVPYGPARAVDVFGDHVYYSSGSMLMIADVSDPAVPIVVGELQMPDLIRDIRVAGGYVHVVCGYGGYLLVDVGLPASPAIVGSYLTGTIPGWEWAAGVAVSGNLVFVSDFIPGLTILDVTNPSAIQHVSDVRVPNSDAVELRGSFAYLTGYDGLQIVDISDPKTPVIAGTAPGEGYELDVVGDYAYVAGYMDGLIYGWSEGLRCQFAWRSSRDQHDRTIRGGTRCRRIGKSAVCR